MSQAHPEQRVSFVVVESPIHQVNQDNFSQIFAQHHQLKSQSPTSTTLAGIRKKLEQSKQKIEAQQQKKLYYQSRQRQVSAKNDQATPYQNANQYKIQVASQQKYPRPIQSQHPVFSHPPLDKLFRDIKSIKQTIHQLKSYNYNKQQKIQTPSFQDKRLQNLQNGKRLQGQQRKRESEGSNKNMSEIRNRYITYQDYVQRRDLQKISYLNYRPYNRSNRVSEPEQVNIRRFQIQFDAPSSQKQ